MAVDSFQDFDNGYHYEYQIPHWQAPEEPSRLDPQLHTLQLHPSYTFVHSQQDLDAQRFCTTYNPTAHGFSHVSPTHPDVTCNVFDQLSYWNGDFGHSRQFRYLSPSEPLLSSPESSDSDYTLSPDIVRSSQEFSFSPTDLGFQRGSISMAAAPNQSWMSPPSLFHGQPAALSMKDLQVTPDPEIEDGPADDKEPLQAKLGLSEEPELPEQLAILVKPSLGRLTTDDDANRDEDEDEDYGAQKSDDDSEFRPGKRQSRRNSTIPRRSLRSHRQPAPQAVIDPDARVHKSSYNQGSLAMQSRSKSKRLSRKKSKPGVGSLPCSFHHYGCEGNFVNKNEWKRHVSSKHLQLGYYRCDLGPCSPEVVESQHKGFNDFNRKDLFTQHCRRMHAPWDASRPQAEIIQAERDAFEEELEHTRSRCWIVRRKAPEKSTCGICGQRFVNGRDSKAWELRMEHVGRHFERGGARKEDEAIDVDLQKWAINEGIIHQGGKNGDTWVLVGFEPPKPAPPIPERRRSRRATTVTKKVKKPEDSPAHIEAMHAGVYLKA